MMLQTTKALDIYLAEDDPDDQYFIRASLESVDPNIRLKCFFNGRQIVDALEELAGNNQTLPNIIILDINMPQLDGFQTLKILKGNPKLAHLPVLIYTTSRSEEDIRSVYSFGASAYIVKPLSFDQIKEKFMRVFEYWGGVSELPSSDNDGR